MAFGSRQPRGKKLAVDFFHPVRKQPQGNLRGAAKVRHAERTPPRIQHLYGIAWRRASVIDNITRKNPRMSRGDPAGRLAVDFDFAHWESATALASIRPE